MSLYHFESSYYMSLLWCLVWYVIQRGNEWLYNCFPFVFAHHMQAMMEDMLFLCFRKIYTQRRNMIFLFLFFCLFWSCDDFLLLPSLTIPNRTHKSRISHTEKNNIVRLITYAQKADNRILTLVWYTPFIKGLLGSNS